MPFATNGHPIMPSCSRYKTTAVSAKRNDQKKISLFSVLLFMDFFKTSICLSSVTLGKPSVSDEYKKSIK